MLRASCRARVAGPALVCLAAGLLVLGTAAGALAQSEPSAADREAAASAFDRGTASYLAHDYSRAAQWFETAYGLAPSSAALVSAIRAFSRAGDLLRAGSLALRIPALYGDEAAAVRVADEIIPQATPLYVRVDVTCSSECTIELDGAIATFNSFFVDPTSSHTVRAAFSTGTREETVEGAAGETRALAFDAPEATVATVDTDTNGTEEATLGGLASGDGSTTTTDTGGGGGISPAAFGTMLALTVASGGVLVGAGLWALDGVPAYEADPTAERLADGQVRETLTNAMIGVTAGLAITTLVLAIVTDWDGDSSSGEEDAPSSGTVSASIDVSPDGAIGTVWGTF